MPIHKKKKKTRCLTVVVKLTSSQSLNSVEWSFCWSKVMRKFLESFKFGMRIPLAHLVAHRTMVFPNIVGYLLVLTWSSRSPLFKKSVCAKLHSLLLFVIQCTNAVEIKSHPLAILFLYVDFQNTQFVEFIASGMKFRGLILPTTQWHVQVIMVMSLIALVYT